MAGRSISEFEKVCQVSGPFLHYKGKIPCIIYLLHVAGRRYSTLQLEAVQLLVSGLKPYKNVP